MKSILFAIFLTAVLSLSVSNSFACSCVYIPIHSVDFRKSNSVFVGEVASTDVGLSFPEKLKGTMASTAMKFRVVKSWKGAKASEIIAWFEYGGCGQTPQLGEKYLVYTRKYKGQTVFNTFCSRTRLYKTINEGSLKEYKDLNSFGFRFWSNFAYFNFR